MRLFQRIAVAAALLTMSCRIFDGDAHEAIGYYRAVSANGIPAPSPDPNGVAASDIYLREDGTFRQWVLVCTATSDHCDGIEERWTGRWRETSNFLILDGDDGSRTLAPYSADKLSITRPKQIIYERRQPPAID